MDTGGAEAGTPTWPSTFLKMNPYLSQAEAAESQARGQRGQSRQGDCSWQRAEYSQKGWHLQDLVLCLVLFTKSLSSHGNLHSEQLLAAGLTFQGDTVRPGK